MKNRGFISPLLLVVGLVVIAGGVTAVWWRAKQQETTTDTAAVTLPLATTTDTSIRTVAVSEMQTTERAIRDALFASATPEERTLYKALEEGNGELINVVEEGDHYALFAILTYTTIGPNPSIFDKQTNKIVGDLPEGLELVTARGRVIISRQDICLYLITQSSCIPLAGARLSGSEVYPYLYYDWDWPVPPHATTTGSVLTVGVYDRDPLEGSSAKGLGTTTEVRLSTFTLP